MADVQITSVVNTPSANIATIGYVDNAISGIDLSPYWNSDGTSEAFWDWDIWHNKFTAQKIWINDFEYTEWLGVTFVNMGWEVNLFKENEIDFANLKAFDIEWNYIRAMQWFILHDEFDNDHAIMRWNWVTVEISSDWSPWTLKVGSLFAGAIVGEYGSNMLQFSSFEPRIICAGSDFEIESSSYGIILRDSSDVRWRVQVDTYWNLFTTSLPI